MNSVARILLCLSLVASLASAAPTTTLSIDEQRQLLFVVSKRVAPDLPQPEILTFLAGDIPEAKLRELQVIAASNGTDPVTPPVPAVPSRSQVPANDLNRIKAAAYFATIPYCGSGDQIRSLSCGPKCQNAAVTGSKVTRILEGESTLGFVAVRPNPREIYVSFRGTSTEQNEADNMDLALVAWPFASPRGAPAMQVHRGFTRVYNAVRNQTLAAVREIAMANPFHQIYFTGHSLGGAVATMAALDAFASGIAPARRIGVVSFGSPRVGNRAFSQVASGAGFRCLERVVNNNDVVAHIPARVMGYEHTAGQRYIQGDKTYICGGPEDESCSNQRIPYVSYMSHIQFFSQQPFFGRFGCPNA